MKIMYIAPRFHTNQAAVVKGWLERGDEVLFISYYTAIIEDYSCIHPVVLGFSPLYLLIDKLYMEVLHRRDVAASAFKINHGFPPILKLHKIIKEWNPDVIILRDRTLYTIAGYLLGRKSKCILYNQSPLWDYPPKRDFKHRLVIKVTPKYRMTPVMGRKDKEKIITEHSYFIPFVVEPRIAPNKRQYFNNDYINILCIGKFEPRKHHMMLMDVVSELAEETKEKYHLTVIGEATGRLQKEFLMKVQTHVKEHHYEDMVTLLTNVPKEKTNEYFAGTDVFVIPSTDEMASISQLEAMSFSIPVICSDENGSACYVVEGKNGYQFRDCDREDLKKKLEILLSSREKIVGMGAKAYQSVLDNNLFQNYYDGIQKIIKDMDRV
ncbi:MAG: glycosyltransferase family 4 protein [Clostridium sp.]|nr:glycosyltransferase family 4 protein [Clostridium sp.]